MKIGKASDSVLKRSVLKEIKYKKETVCKGAAVGTDCAVFDFGSGADEAAKYPSGGACLAATTNVVTEDVPDKGMLAVHMAVNNLAAQGAQPLALETALLFPGQSSEEELRLLVRQIDKTCGQLGVPLVGGHTEITRAVRHPVVAVTGVGRICKEDMEAGRIDGKAKDDGAGADGLDIVMTKWAGLAGTYLAAEKRFDDLKMRFPEDMLEEAGSFRRYLSVVPEAAIAGRSGAAARKDVSRGGILGALWELAECAGTGLEVDLKKIPIRQETVEICNYLDLNPYGLLSTGSLLVLIRDGQGLVEKFMEEGLMAAVIGKTTDGNDRLIYVDDEARYLTRPGTDELLKIK